MGEEIGIGIEVAKLNDVLMPDDLTSAAFGHLLGRHDDPVVVRCALSVYRQGRSLEMTHCH